MPLFSKMIYCSECGKKFRFKRQREKATYICGGYSNYGKDFCRSNPISENQLLSLIEMRYRRKLDEDEIREEIDSIYIGFDKIQINYKNEEPTILTNKYAQF